jgi:hypothetical protein
MDCVSDILGVGDPEVIAVEELSTEFHTRAMRGIATVTGNADYGMLVIIELSESEGFLEGTGEKTKLGNVELVDDTVD